MHLDCTYAMAAGRPKMAPSCPAVPAHLVTGSCDALADFPIEGLGVLQTLPLPTLGALGANGGNIRRRRSGQEARRR